MKSLFEIGSEAFAVAAAVLWFASARLRLQGRSISRKAFEAGVDDSRALLRLVYEQSRWSAWAAIAAGLAALCALADGLVPGT